MKNIDDLRLSILAVFKKVYTQQNETPPPDIEDNTILLKTGLDSMGFAILVATLEDELGYDPFTLSSSAFYPITFGEFLRFYHENTPDEF